MDSKRHFCGISPNQIDIENYRSRVAEIKMAMLARQGTMEYTTMEEPTIEVPIAFHVLTGRTVSDTALSNQLATINNDFASSPSYSEDIRGEYAFDSVRAGPGIQFVFPETQRNTATNEGAVRFEIIYPPIGAPRLVHYPDSTEDTAPISSANEVQISINGAIDLMKTISPPVTGKLNVYIYGVSRTLYGFAEAIGDTNIVAISSYIPTYKTKGQLDINVGTDKHILSHEIGHAFGLLHIFSEGSYLGNNDDTPPQEYPSGPSFSLITDVGSDGAGTGALIKGTGCNYEKDRYVDGLSIPARIKWAQNNPIDESVSENPFYTFKVGCVASSMSESTLNSLIAAFTSWCANNSHSAVECVDCVHTTDGTDYRLHAILGRIDREGNTTLASAAVDALTTAINAQDASTSTISSLCGGFKALSTNTAKEDNISVFSISMGPLQTKEVFVPLNERVLRGNLSPSAIGAMALSEISSRLGTICSSYPKVFPCGFAGQGERYGFTLRVGGFTPKVREAASAVFEDVMTGGFDTAISNTLFATRDTSKSAYFTEPVVSTSGNTRQMANNIMDYSEYLRYFTALQVGIMRTYAQKLVNQEEELECPSVTTSPGLKLTFKGDVFKLKSGQGFPAHENVYTALNEKASGRTRFRIASLYEGISKQNGDLKAVDSVLKTFIHEDYFDSCNTCSTGSYDDVSDRTTLDYRAVPIERRPTTQPLTQLKLDIADVASALSGTNPPQSLISKIEAITGSGTLDPESTTSFGVSFPVTDQTIGFSWVPFTILVVLLLIVLSFVVWWYAYGRQRFAR